MSFYWFDDSGVRSVRPLSQTDAVRESPAKKKKGYQQQPPPQQERKPALTASQIMRSPVKTLNADTPFEKAREFFKESRFRHVPIVDDDGKLIGVISDRDVLREAANMVAGPDGWIQEVASQKVTIGDFMTKRVLTATPAAEIREIAKAMFEERIGSMPIVNEDHKLVGIITRSDILRTLVNHAPLELWI